MTIGALLISLAVGLSVSVGIIWAFNKYAAKHLARALNNINDLHEDK